MKSYVQNLNTYTKDILAWLHALPEYQRMILALMSMGLAVVMVYGTWNYASSPIANLGTNNGAKSEQRSVAPIPTPQTDSPASGIIESFKNIEAIFLSPRIDQQESPGMFASALSASRIALDWVKVKALTYVYELANKTRIKSEKIGLYLSQLLILYTSRTAQ